MSVKRTSLMLLFCFCSGCSTIHFTQNVDAQYQQEHSLEAKWHDTTLDGMVEVSPPVNLYKECKGKPWKRVTSELTFTNGFVTVLVSGVVSAIAPVLEFVNLYTPWTVKTTCAE